MNVRTLPRTAVDGYLRLLRAPLDRVIGLLPGDGTGARPAAQATVDRADAQLRGAIGRVLRDPDLSEDAQRRMTAAQQRRSAIELRDQAERTAEKADSKLEQREQEATRRRRQASERTQARRRQASQSQEQRKRRAAQAESRRLSATRQAAERRDAQLEQQAARERLETLDTKSDALRQKEKEVTARDEARRLREAADRAKAERKAD